jgi:site-specific recombinase XerD
MKSLQNHLQQYVVARRALGTQLREPAKTLSGFIQFLSRKKAKFITIPLALEWSQQSKNVQRATWARKLSMVRQFARWLSVIEPRHQVPPPRLLNVRHRRNKPHIYSDQEIVRLMAAAAALKSPRGMKGRTLGTLIGLLAATGLRPGEAGALENQDVDFEAGVLVIRESKFGKSRLVPVHKSVVTALGKYARERNRIVPIPFSSTFFVSDRGMPLDLTVVRSWFRQVSKSCGLRKGPTEKRSGRGPRLQDMRHHSERRIIPSGV